MGKRGPAPAGPKLQVLNPAIKQRPKPIPGMTQYARIVWKRVVNSHNPDHFKPQILEQFRVYCESASSHKKACREIAKSGEIITQKNGVIKRNPWCNERDSCAGVMASMSTKLKLNIHSGRTEKGETLKPKSKREGLIYKGD